VVSVNGWEVLHHPLSSLCAPQIAGQWFENDDQVFVVVMTWLQLLDHDFFLKGYMHWFPAGTVASTGMVIM
jgi:hypothetical protein